MSIDIKEAAHRLGRSEKTLRRWVHTGKMAAHLEEGRLMFAVQDIEAHQVAPSESQRIELLEQRVSELEKRLARLEQARHPPSTKVLRPPRIPYQAEAPGHSTMPEGLTGWRSFSRLHGVAESTVQATIKAGNLKIVQGSWVVGHAPVRGALDQAGRARFYELYHDKPQFKPCDECPHLDF